MHAFKKNSFIASVMPTYKAKKYYITYQKTKHEIGEAKH